MKEMMKRCLSLGFSLSIVVFSGIWRVKTPPSVGRLPKAPEPRPMPASVPLPQALSRFSGTVVRDGSRFALRNHNGSLYALDSTGRAWPFEGEDVEVRGYLDDASQLLHICAIETVDDLKAEAV